MTPDKLNGIQHIDPMPMFLWLCCAGGLGVLFTVLFRRHFLDDPKMVFADGVAAAETITVLDSTGGEAGDKLQWLSICALASALVDWFREGMGVLHDWFITPLFHSYKVGIEWNLLSIGSGLLIGLNVSLSMLAATVVVAATGPVLIDHGIGKSIVLSNVHGEQCAECERLIDKKWEDLTAEEQGFVEKYGGKQADYMKGDYFSILLLWFMWPATGLMITSAITAVLVRWRSVVESFTHLRLQARHGQSEDISLKTILIGSVLLTVPLAIIQHVNFGMSYLQTAVAVLCSLPLILVGVRVLGETNNGPISVMMNGLQAVFAVFWPSSIGHNLIASGVAGTCNAAGQGTIQDYKTGKLLGSTPRVLTWAQLAGVPIGAAAVAIMYPLLLHKYKLGTDLTTPTGVKIANMAVFAGQGDRRLAARRTLLDGYRLDSGSVAGSGQLLSPHWLATFRGWIWFRAYPAGHAQCTHGHRRHSRLVVGTFSQSVLRTLCGHGGVGTYRRGGIAGWVGFANRQLATQPLSQNA